MSDKEPLAQPAQPPAYPSGGQPQATTVQYVQQVQPAGLNLREFPVVATCPIDGHQVTTNVHYKAGLMVWLVVGLVIVFGGLCFAWVPFLIDSLKDVVHTCPEDGTIIGVYERLKF